MKLFQAVLLSLFPFFIDLTIAIEAGSRLCGFDRKHESLATGCVEMHGIDGMQGKWMEQEGLHNGHPYYYNAKVDMYLYMTFPFANNIQKLFYTVNANLEDTSVLHGYCAQENLDILDCGARWRVNHVLNTQARFEACAATLDA